MASTQAGLDDILKVEDGSSRSTTPSPRPTPAARLFTKSPNNNNNSNNNRAKRRSGGILKQLSTSSYTRTATAAANNNFGNNDDFELRKRISESEGNIRRKIDSDAENNEGLGGFGFASGSGRRKRGKFNKQYSNLFPCPMVKTLDLDSPEGSMSSLG